MDNIWGEDQADMQLINKLIRGFIFLLCFIDIYSKYAWVTVLKDKKGITVTNDFQKNLDESNHKPNKTWFDNGSEFYNKSIKSWLEKTYIDMYCWNIHHNFKKQSPHYQRNAYIDKLDDIVNKYNNAYHSSVKMKPVDVRSNLHIDSYC